MQREKLIFCGISDLAGHLRGKAFPEADLAARGLSGMGIPPANITLSAFGPILADPFGTAGDLALIPDFSTRVTVPFGPDDPGESFVLADIVAPGGSPWACCPRDFPRRALDGLAARGLRVFAAFEQEFYVAGLAGPQSGSFRHAGLRRAGMLGEALLGALRGAGCTPDSFVPEYAPGQFEVTVAPKPGLRAADEAVITREMIVAVAGRLGQHPTLAPILSPDGIGSGTHIHISLQHDDGTPALYDPTAPDALSTAGKHFVAGLARYLPDIVALTAPSVPSYYRLTPGRWAPTAADVATGDRGAAIRLCRSARADPGSQARGFNVEFRVADATASPYMALGAVLHAGLQGIADEQERANAPTPLPLPQNLGAALDGLQASPAAKAWMGPELHGVYLQFKRAEIASLDGLSPAEICARYAAAY